MVRVYAPLAKAEENDDGTLRIRGVASAENVDSAGETITSDAMRAALPDFLRDGVGSLRVMHQLIAAGTVDTAEVTKTGETIITATVVDEDAIRKIRKNVYRGLSVGGRVLKRDPKDAKIITKLVLNEVSLVDRGANPLATFTIWKAAGQAPRMGDREAIGREMAAMTPEARALLLTKAVHKLGVGRVVGS